MTLCDPITFIVGCLLVGIIGFAFGRILRLGQVEALRIEKENLHNWWCEAEVIIRDLEKRIKRYHTPRDKKGKFTKRK